MATIFGKLIRGVVASVAAPINAITGANIGGNYTGQAGQALTGVFGSLIGNVLGGGQKTATDTNATSAPAANDVIQQAINKLFGGLANQVGTSAGTAAAQGIQTSVIPKWLWPLVGVIGLVLIFVLLFRKKLKL